VAVAVVGALRRMAQPSVTTIADYIKALYCRSPKWQCKTAFVFAIKACTLLKYAVISVTESQSIRRF